MEINDTSDMEAEEEAGALSEAEESKCELGCMTFQFAKKSNYSK